MVGESSGFQLLRYYEYGSAFGFESLFSGKERDFSIVSVGPVVVGGAGSSFAHNDLLNRRARLS